MQYCQKTGRNLVQLYTQPFSSLAKKRNLFFTKIRSSPLAFFAKSAIIEVTPIVTTQMPIYGKPIP